VIGGKAPSRINEGWGRLPIDKASKIDHGMGGSSHRQSCIGRKETKCGGKRDTFRENAETREETLGRTEGGTLSSNHKN
jgi:hypothetical protein